MQAAFARALSESADERRAGRVGTAWDFDLTSADGRVHRLVPDVAFLAYARVSYDDDEAPANPARKIEIYLAAGVELALVVDPRAEYAVLHDRTGTVTITRDGTIEHRALPGFRLSLERAFAKAPQPA